jgi:beta-mannosidase
MVYCELVVNGRAITSNQVYFAPFKDLSLASPKIASEIIATRNGFKITLNTDKLARGVYLSTKTDGFFSDNYFDLLPDKPVELEFRTTAKVTLDEFKEKLRIRSLKDAFNSSDAVTTNE